VCLLTLGAVFFSVSFKNAKGLAKGLGRPGSSFVNIVRKWLCTSSRIGDSEIYRVPEQPFLPKGGMENTGNIDAALREKRQESNEKERRPKKDAIGSACTPPMRSSRTLAKSCCVRPAVVKYGIRRSPHLLVACKCVAERRPCDA
jgi:hypothetical protein